MQQRANIARTAAIETIEKFISQQRYHLFERSYFTKQEDASLYFSIVKQTTRYFRKYEFYLSYLVKRKPTAKAKACLLTAFAQLDESMQMKAHAVVFETVAIIKRSKETKTAPFINGVLQNFIRSFDQIKQALLQESFAIQQSYPDWIIAKWETQWGKEKTKEICLASNMEPSLQITLLKEEEKQSLEEQGFKLTQLEESIYHVTNPRSLFATEAYKNGAFFVQDISSALLWHILAPLPKTKFLDLCSAPGGKLFQWEYRFAQDIEQLTAIESNLFRFESLQENAKRLGSKATLLHEDITTWQTTELFDIVVLDSPCTATGTMRKNPEIKWKRTKEDINEAQVTQKNLLSHASRFVKQQGYLLYITCSLEKEENEEIISHFLQNHTSYSIVNLKNTILQKHALITNSFYRCFPSVNTMGLFAALLQNKSQ